jgi:hypothetical protein
MTDHAWSPALGQTVPVETDTVFDPNQNQDVSRIHPRHQSLGTPTPKSDPSHVKRPALFMRLGGVNVSGNENGTVQFGGTGVITRAAMRDLIMLFEQWDTEEDL